jgi:phage FluMu protein Com
MIKNGENRCDCHKLILKYNEIEKVISIKCPKCGGQNEYSITDLVNWQDAYKKK